MNNFLGLDANGMLLAQVAVHIEPSSPQIQDFGLLEETRVPERTDMRENISWYQESSILRPCCCE